MTTEDPTSTAEQLRTEPILLDGLSATQGTDGRITYDLPVISPGYVLSSDGNASKWLIPTQAVRTAVPLLDGAACYIDHPEEGFFYQGEPQVKNLAGAWTRPYYHEERKQARAAFTPYQTPSGQLAQVVLDTIIADNKAGRKTPDIGISALFYSRKHTDPDTGEKVTDEFTKIISADLVYSPGARAYIRDALAAIPTGERPQREERSHMMSDQVSPTTGVQSPPPAAEPVAVNPQLDALTAEVRRLAEIVAKKEEPSVIQGMGTAPRQPITSGQMTTGLEQIQAAWDFLFGVKDAKVPPPDLRRTDRLYYLLTGDGGWRGVFNGADALAAANPTTLADMAVNAMNKVIIPLYDTLANYRWYEIVTAVQPTDGSLHDMAWITFGGIANLPVVADGAAYTELTVADAKESDSFVKYGGYVGITEKLLRNSEIARIQAIPKALTVAAVRTRSAAIANIFTQASGTGPTLDDDSVKLFHTATHGNLATTAFSYSAWAAARLECYKMTELGSSKRIGFWPRFWLGPADLYDTALNVFGYGAGVGGKPSTSDNDVNPYALDRPGDPRPIPIAVPEFTDTNDWAYLVDPNLQPVIQMAYADNPGGRSHPAPELYAVTSPLAGLMFTNDTLPIKVRDQWACGVSGYRGIGKRNVT